MYNLIELENIKTLLDITDGSEDEKLELYMENAERYILGQTNRTEILDSMIPIFRDLVVYLYKQADRNGIQSETEGEESITYSSDNKLPISITSQLNSFRRNKVCLW